tara:strand:- start:63 stop:659 length:597 start_codon:yes stop_codon:yes gene_type:complete
MIKITDINNSEPYILFNNLYNKALIKNQKNIEAISVSSFDRNLNEVQSRYVNLKYLQDNKWIFFSNYNSPKAESFKTHDQVSILFFWQTINIQIRMKAKIIKTSESFNNDHFFNRSKEKNALAISSDQSKLIDSYKTVKTNYKNALESDNLLECPKYWGGFSFTPYYFEFWEGHKSRLNKREIYEMKRDKWEHFFIQP